MASKNESNNLSDERNALLNDPEGQHYGSGMAVGNQQNSLGNSGVQPPRVVDLASVRRSFADLENYASAKDEPIPLGRGYSSGNNLRPSRSFYMTPDGSTSFMTPVDMGRHELYEELPMTAVFGLQKKERSMSMAFASFAADLDVLEQSQNSLGNLTEADKMNKKSHGTLLLLDELEVDAKVMSTPLLCAVLVATMAQFLVGYNTGVMNAPSAVVFAGHSTGTWAIAVAAFAVGGPFGANVAGSLADSRGRRGALLLNTWVFLFGGIIQSCALDMFSIIISRLIIGFASGFSSVLVPIYLGELAPPTLRGTLGTMTQFAMVVGILVSDILAFPFATEKLWRVLFAVTPVFAIIQLLLAPYLLESPRWLLGRDKNSRKARFIIKKLRGLRYDHEVETEANHYVAAFEAQNKNSDGYVQTSSQKELTKAAINSEATIAEMVNDKDIRILLVSVLVLQMAQQLCGINAVFYYSNMFFDGVIDDPLVGTTLVAAVNVAATYVALLLMDSCGRRTLLLWSSGGMFVCCIVLVLSLLHVFPNIVALGAVNMYVSFFEIGLGPIPWLIVAEMFDAKYVSVAMSVACQVNWSCNIIVGLVFPFLNDYLGPYSFIPFATVLLGTFMFVYVWLPETHGTTPEELQAALVKKNSETIYHNMDIDNAYSNPIDMEWKRAMDELKQEDIEKMNDGSFDYGFKPIVSNQAISG